MFLAVATHTHTHTHTLYSLILYIYFFSLLKQTDAAHRPAVLDEDALLQLTPPPHPPLLPHTGTLNLHLDEGDACSLVRTPPPRPPPPPTSHTPAPNTHKQTLLSLPLLDVDHNGVLQVPVLLSEVTHTSPPPPPPSPHTHTPHILPPFPHLHGPLTYPPPPPISTNPSNTPPPPPNLFGGKKKSTHSICLSRKSTPMVFL